MLKVCLDSNVLVSGIVYGGLPGVIVDLVFAKDLRLVTSEFILDEVERNAMRCGQDRWSIRFLRHRLEELAEFTNPKGHIKVRGVDPGDAMVLETAWLAKARYLITGDQDLLRLKHFKYTRIIEPKHLLELLNRK
ncbi:MAG: putative toxin-antitoxin system toxin component, PIN family [Deltaproteobacteria bacterium]|nr:putative toxin-antitoxin system toxin component, PIN family [Deltaproteobacteria bacterium]